MVKKKNKNHNFWFSLGLIAILLEAPNATVLKFLTFSMDPFVMNLLRFLVVGLVTLPFLIKALPNYTKRNTKNLLLASINMVIAIFSFTWALKFGPASYVSIIMLITPILLVALSMRMTGDRINARSLAGITLAALGAMIIVILPVALGGDGEFVFYPEASALTLINCLTFSLSIIYSKRANEQGLSMPAILSTHAWLTVIASAIIVSAASISFQIPNGLDLLLLLYSGIGVGLVARALSIYSYEHVGAAVTSALAYLGSFASILIPVVVLDERLSVEIVTGGILILLGIYVLEHHKSSHGKHHHILKSH